MNVSLILAAALTLAQTGTPGAQKVELLYPDGAPGAVGDTPADKPTLNLYLPPADKANGTAVVVLPGGGYGGLADSHEGKDPAEYLNKQGIAAFVLRYRHAPRYKHPTPLQDAQRALRSVRARAKDFKLDPARIGIWGFSAGGHLASTAATQWEDAKPDATDPLQRVSSRPDFAILCYPVITLEAPYAHMGSRNNLLGKDADAKLVESLCNERRVTDKTPPTFLFHTGTDTAVPPENSILFYQALRKAKVPAELHIYEKGPHGVGLAAKDEVLSSWPERLTAWLKTRGLIPKG